MLYFSFQQHAQYRAKVFKASHKVRAISLGQDRYKRRYWVLPTAGGVYVEGAESGYFDEEIQESSTKQEVKEEIEEEVEEKIKEEVKDKVKEEVKDSVKQEVKLEQTEVKDEVKGEVKERKDILKIPVYKKEIKSEREEFNAENVIKSEKLSADHCDSNQNSSQTDQTNSSENISNTVKMENTVTKCNGQDLSIPSTSRCNSAMSESSDSKTPLQNSSSKKPSQTNSSLESDMAPIISSAHASPLISPYPAAPSPFFSPPISGASPSLLSGLSFSSAPSSSSSTPLPAHQQPK